MSRIIVLEVPDKYEVSGRYILKQVQKLYPDVELRLSAGFDWWKNICTRTSVDCLPLLPNKNIDDDFISDMKNPKSIEERY